MMANLIYGIAILDSMIQLNINMTTLAMTNKIEDVMNMFGFV